MEIVTIGKDSTPFKVEINNKRYLYYQVTKGTITVSVNDMNNGGVLRQWAIADYDPPQKIDLSSFLNPHFSTNIDSTVLYQLI